MADIQKFVWHKYGHLPLRAREEETEPHTLSGGFEAEIECHCTPDIFEWQELTRKDGSKYHTWVKVLR